MESVTVVKKEGEVVAWFIMRRRGAN